MKEKVVRPDPDFWRQLDVFNPYEFTDRVDIIGCGATGSYIAFLLAKMGVETLHVHDFDKVEDYNIPNQVFGPSDVGKTKVGALLEFIEKNAAQKIMPHNEKVKTSPDTNYLFVLTDTMASRKEIWTSAKKCKHLKLMIETRMAVDGGILFCVDPKNGEIVKRYEETLHSDAEAEESPCTRRAIASTVAMLASMATSAFLNHVNKQEVPFRKIISTNPLSIY